jgi:hypothetical protein
MADPFLGAVAVPRQLLDILQLAPEAERREAAAKRAKTSNARASKAIKSLQSKLYAADDQRQKLAEQLAVAATVSGECRSVLGIRAKHSDKEVGLFAKMWAFMRLATSRRRLDDAGRLRQQCSHELVANSALSLQRLFWDRMLSSASQSRGAGPQGCDARGASQDGPSPRNMAFLGCKVMWDEAAHKLRPLLKHGNLDTSDPASGHAVLQVMSMVCLLTCVCIGFARDGSGEWASVQRWEPWLCPLRILSSTSTNCILHALITSMPFCIDDPDARKNILEACDLFVRVLCCDAASGNIRSLRYFLHQCSLEPRFLFHCEICSIHQIHIIKTKSFEMVTLAGTLYSLSKIMRSSSTLVAFESALRKIVRSRARLCIRAAGSADGDTGLLSIVKQLYIAGGDDSYLYHSKPGKPKVPTPLFQALLDLCAAGTATPSGELVLFLDDLPDIRKLSASQRMDMALESFMKPVVYLFVKRAWPPAALSRWTYVTENLRKVIFGCNLGKLLPQALSSLSTELNINEGKIDDALRKYAQIEAAGGVVGQSSEWAKHGKRVLKVSSFFAAPGQWKFACLLIGTLILDKLHHGIIGQRSRKGRPSRQGYGAHCTRVGSALDSQMCRPSCPNRWGRFVATPTVSNIEH